MLLLVDDLFMLHERIFPNQFGIDEIIVFLFYGLLFLVYLLLFRKVILETDHIYLSLTVFFLYIFFTSQSSGARDFNTHVPLL